MLAFLLHPLTLDFCCCLLNMYVSLLEVISIVVIDVGVNENVVVTPRMVPRLERFDHVASLRLLLPPQPLCLVTDLVPSCAFYLNLASHCAHCLQ